MSVLIKGMEMPEAGEHILSLYVYHDGTATVIGQHRHYEKEPFEVIQIPPNGRLIDADALRCWPDASAMMTFDYVTRSQINTYSPCECSHTGILESVQNGSITTIEGNTSLLPS